MVCFNGSKSNTQNSQNSSQGQPKETVQLPLVQKQMRHLNKDSEESYWIAEAIV